MSRSASIAALALLAAVALVFFGRIVLAGETLAHDDLGFWFFPWKALLFHMAQQGGVSFWLPSEFCGMPHMADIQRQIFYPPNAIFYLVPTEIAMCVFVAFHFFVATALMFAWLRAMRLDHPIDVPSALCGALVFGFAAFPVLHLSQLPMLASYVWIPGFMLSLEQYLAKSVESGRIATPWLAAGGVFFCLLLLGGAPQMVYITCVMGVCYAWFLAAMVEEPVGSTGQARFPRLLGMVAVAAVVVPIFGAGLAALQLVPMAELTAWTTRQPAVSSAYSSIGTARPDMLWTLIHPYIFGNPMDGSWKNGYTFHEECLYVGVVALLLSAAGIADARRGGLRVGFFVIAALLGVIIALGNYIQLPERLGGVGMHDVFRNVLPGFGKFRVPPRWMVLTVVSVSVLAAFGANALARYRPPRDRQALGGALPLAATMICAFGLAYVLLYARSTMGLSFEQARWSLMLVFSTLAAAAVCRLPWAGSWASLGLVLLVGADLLTFAGAYVRGSPSPAASPDIRIIRDLAANRSVGRIVTHTDAAIPTQLATWCGPLGVRNIQGTNPLFLKPYIDYLHFSQSGELPDAQDTGTMHHNGFFVVGPVTSPMTRMLNLTDVVEELEKKTPPSSAPTWLLSEGRGLIWDRRVSGGLGVAWAVPGYRVIRDEVEMLARMRRAEWDPKSEALFYEDPGLSMRSSGAVDAVISVIRHEADSLTLKVRVDKDAIVVFSEIYYPGWVCTVDGAQTPVLRANAILRAVPVRAGTHEVVMRYRPTSFLIGLVITVATSLLMALLVARNTRRR